MKILYKIFHWIGIIIHILFETHGVFHGDEKKKSNNTCSDTNGKEGSNDK